MNTPTTHDRRVMDRTREPWTVEETAALAGSRVLRFRHELGYEVVAVTRQPLPELPDAELVRILEEARHRPPRGCLSGAA